ncbi:transmembrane and death domain protein 1 isoform X2 [Gouania willdenowi]|uniref:transmembrane and death domain protein 1 isoform X2 n=1 Tax=Gouania willdenowi TaxID=441366 RepID=UPI00105661A8|nr:uncharacterized protein C12orf81-like isoform X2 [Gouania willdenowi]
MRLWMLLVSLQLHIVTTQDTVSEDIGVHQLERLVELLTSTECEKLLSALSQPEEDIFKRLERLSAEKNTLDVKVYRTKRDVSSATDRKKKRCRDDLTNWLLKNGVKIYYDRLSRALYHIGRTDVAIELGKNINQQKALNLKRYVEDYVKYVDSLKAPSIKLNNNKSRRIKKRKGTWTGVSWI